MHKRFFSEQNFYRLRRKRQRRRQKREEAHAAHPWRTSVPFLCLSGVVLAVSVAIAFLPTENRLLTSPLVRRWSKITLNIYLLHEVFRTWIFPQLFPGKYTVSETMGIMALVCASFFSLALCLGVDRTRSLCPSPLNSYVLLYAVVYLYATLTSSSLQGSLFPGLLTILFVLFFFAVTSCGIRQETLPKLLGAMVGVGVLVSLYGFYQAVFPSQFRNVWTDTDMFSSIAFRVYSTLENPNVLGEYFLLVIPLGAALLVTARSWKGRILWLAACVIMGVCLILTYSRGCYLGLLFAMAMFLVLKDRRFLILGIVAVALCPLYLPETVLTSLCTFDSDPAEQYIFHVYGHQIPIRNDRLAEILLALGDEGYSILLLYYSLQLKDREIASLLGLSRSKIQKDRKILFNELKKRMVE